MCVAADSDVDLLPVDALAAASECLKTLAHPHRLRIVDVLLQGARPVGDLVEFCAISQPACSEHLRLMRHCGLVRSERRGRQVFYSVAEEGLAGIMACIRGRFGNAATSGDDDHAAHRAPVQTVSGTHGVPDAAVRTTRQER
jgi:DNA-binding transcriptional ArsR family regulator